MSLLSFLVPGGQVPVSQSNPVPVIIPGSVTVVTGTGNIATAQVTVGITATLIVAARTNRISATVVQTGTVVVYMGGANVTVLNGVPLGNTQYSTFTFQGGAAIYGIVATGTQTVAVVENY